MISYQEQKTRDFSDGPGARTPHSNAGGSVKELDPTCRN